MPLPPARGRGRTAARSQPPTHTGPCSGPSHHSIVYELSSMMSKSRKVTVRRRTRRSEPRTLASRGGCEFSMADCSRRRTRDDVAVRVAPIASNDSRRRVRLPSVATRHCRSRSARASYFDDSISMICTKAMGWLLCRDPEGQRFSGLGDPSPAGVTWRALVPCAGMPPHP